MPEAERRSGRIAVGQDAGGQGQYTGAVARGAEHIGDLGAHAREDRRRQEFGVGFGADLRDQIGQQGTPEAAAAHRAFEARTALGKTILTL